MLAPYQVIIVQDVSHNHAYSADEVKALEDWVDHGGGLMTLAGYSLATTEVDNVNRLLAPFSMSYLTHHILAKGSRCHHCGGHDVEPTPNWPAALPGAWCWLPVTGNGIATGGGYRARDGCNWPCLRVVGIVRITYNSEWDSHPDYQVQTFWVNAVKWLTAAAQCEVSIPVSNPPR